MNKERANDIYEVILKDEYDLISAKIAKLESSRVMKHRSVAIEKLKLRAQEIEDYFKTKDNLSKETSEIETTKAEIEQLYEELTELKSTDIENEEIKQMREEASKKLIPLQQIIAKSGLSGTEIKRISDRVKAWYDIHEEVYQKTEKIKAIENDETLTKDEKESAITKIYNELLEDQKKIQKLKEEMKAEAEKDDKIKEVQKALEEICKISIDVRYQTKKYQPELDKAKEAKSKELDKKNKELADLEEKLIDSQQKVEGYNKQIKKVNDGVKMQGFLENSIVKREGKISKIKQQIQELETMRDKVQSTRKRAIINNQIQKKQRKMQKIKNNKGTIEDMQRVLLLPKRKLSKIKNNSEITAQAKYNVSERKIEEIAKKKEKLDPNKKLHALKMMFYDIKTEYYVRKKDRALEVLTNIKEGNKQPTTSGGNAVTMPKSTADKLRNGLKQGVINNMTAPQPVAATAGRTK